MRSSMNGSERFRNGWAWLRTSYFYPNSVAFILLPLHLLGQPEPIGNVVACYFLGESRAVRGFRVEQP